jgi:hypothetical protein
MDPSANLIYNLILDNGDLSNVLDLVFDGGDNVRIIANFLDVSLSTSLLPAITLDPSGTIPIVELQKMTVSGSDGTTFFFDYTVPNEGDGYQNISLHEGESPAGNVITTVNGGVLGVKAFIVTSNNNPSILTANLYSDNSYNAFFGIKDDNVKLQFVASEPLSLSVDPSVNFSVNGVSVANVDINTIQTGLLNWESTFDLSQSIYTDGPVNFTIDYVDGASNSGTFNSATDISNIVNGEVTYDNTPPIATLFKRDGLYNLWPGPYKEGDDVSLNIQFSELLNTTITPQIDVSGTDVLFVDSANLIKDFAKSTATYDVFYYNLKVDASLDYNVKLNLSTGRDLGGNLIQTSLSGGFISDTNRTFGIDNSAAIFQFLGIRSNSGYDTKLAKGTERVFIDMSFNEDLSALTATIGGADASFLQDISFVDRRVYTAFRDILSSEASRDLSFSVTATDKASNVVTRGFGAPDVSFTLNDVDQAALGFDVSSTNFSNVRVDNIPPTIADLSFYSNNTFFKTIASSKETAVTGIQSANTITAEFKTSETILDPSSLVFSVNGVSLKNDISYVEATDGSMHWKVYADISYTDITQGDISFSFLMTDEAGNQTTITNTDVSGAYVNQVELDNVSPIVELVEMYSNNPDVSSHAKTGETLFLDLSFNEAVLLQETDVSFEISSYDLSAAAITSVYINDSSNQIRSSITFNSDHYLGNVDFSVITKDRAGNQPAKITKLTELPNVQFDASNPLINVLSFYKTGSTAQDKTWQVRPDNVIELMFTTDSKLRDVSLSFKSGGDLVNAIIPALTPSGETIYTASYTTQYGDSEGKISFDISATDIAGNFTHQTMTDTAWKLSSGDDVSGLVFDLQPRATITYFDLCGGHHDLSGVFEGIPMYKGSHQVRINVDFDQNLNITDASGLTPAITITHTKDDGTSVIDENVLLVLGDNSMNFYYDYDLSNILPNYEAAVTMTAGHANSDMDPVKLDPSSGGFFSYVNHPKVTFSYLPYFDPFVTGTPTITAEFAKTINVSGGIQQARLSGVESKNITLTQVSGEPRKYTFQYTIPEGQSGSQTISLFGLKDDLGNDAANVDVGSYINGIFNIHHNRNFYLSGFDKSIAMTISGSIELGPDAPDRQDVSATAYVYLNTERLAHTFHFTTDATDISDNEVTDVQFDISTGSFTGLFNSAEHSILGNSQVAYDTNSLANVPKIATDYTKNNANQTFSTGTRGIKYDVVRDLAKQLFNTHHAADLFQNEVSLRNNIHDIINTLVSSDITQGITKVVEDCSRALYIGTDNANIGSDLLRQMIKSANTGLSLVRDPSGSTTGMFSGTDMSNLYKMPFQSGDVIQFILNIAGAPDQRRLVGGTGTTHRRYDIRLIADPNPREKNVDPSNNDL